MNQLPLRLTFDTFYIVPIYTNIQDFKVKNSVITVGSFDGVHRGHKELLRYVSDVAMQNGCTPAVLTFWPHPRQIIDADNTAPQLLNTLDEKIELLAQAGIDSVILLPFDQKFSQMTAKEFVSEILVKQLHVNYLIIGQDHHFGKDRSGNSQNIFEYINEQNIKIVIVDLKKTDQKISSSAIRKALKDGNIQKANDLLGYDYIISGKVVSGDHLGRTIGFPTANIAVPDYKLLPKDGVYRVILQLKNQTHTGMLYIGTRPVVNGHEHRIEVNIFNFNQKIYSEEVKLLITHRIRDDIEFANLEQLTTQLYLDKENALKLGG